MCSKSELRFRVTLRNLFGKWKCAAPVHQNSARKSIFKGWYRSSTSALKSQFFGYNLNKFYVIVNGFWFWLSVFYQVKGLPFNRYTWLTTHNSFARLGVRSATGSILLTPMNQQDSITDQLNVCSLLLFSSWLVTEKITQYY